MAIGYTTELRALFKLLPRSEEEKATGDIFGYHAWLTRSRMAGLINEAEWARFLVFPFESLRRMERDVEENVQYNF